MQERCTLWASGKGTLLVPESVELEERRSAERGLSA